MDLFASLVRPLLFRISADRAHDLAQRALRHRGIGRLLGRSHRFEDPRLATDLGGLHLPNPIGLAPGFDKNGDLVPGLDQLGFGYLVIGSVTKQRREGNPRPRLIRYPDSLSLGNSMGLPNRGVVEAVQNLDSMPRARTTLIAGVAGFNVEDIVETVTAVEPHVSAVEISLICPNATRTERMGELSMFSALARQLAAQVRKPVFVKLPRHYGSEQRRHVFELVDLCRESGFAGVSVGGARQIAEPRFAAGRGSLTGREIFDDALRMVGEVATHSKGDLEIKASGGVFTGSDAARMLAAGATTIEVYSSFVYRGWQTAGMLKRELLDVLDAHELISLDGLRPTSQRETP